MAKKWIQKAHLVKGALHRALGIAPGKKIPKSRITAASKKKGRLGKMARAAKTLSKLARRKKSKK